MKIPLHYQISEYDCGPTSLMNMIAYLYHRKGVPQIIFRKIYTLTLDGYATNGKRKSGYGTSDQAMEDFAAWINGFHDDLEIHLQAKILKGEQVCLKPDGELEHTLQNGGCAVAKVMLREPHYVLLTGVKTRQKCVRLFDPYYREKNFRRDDVHWTLVHPKEYNCVIPYTYLNRRARTYYSFGPSSQRLCVLFTEAIIKTDGNRLKQAEGE